MLLWTVENLSIAHLEDVIGNRWTILEKISYGVKLYRQNGLHKMYSGYLYTSNDFGTLYSIQISI